MRLGSILSSSILQIPNILKFPSNLHHFSDLQIQKTLYVPLPHSAILIIFIYISNILHFQ